MSFATKYKIEWSDCQGTDWTYDIQEDGFAGAVTSLQASGDPLNIDYFGEDDIYESRIMGSKADINIETTSDFELMDLFTSDNLEYKVRIYRKPINLINSLTNDSFETLTKTGTEISSAINTSGTGLAYSDEFTVIDGEIITVIFYLTLNSGDKPLVILHNNTTSTQTYQLAAEGLNILRFQSTDAGQAVVYFYLTSNTNFSTSEVFTYRGPYTSNQVILSGGIPTGEMVFWNGYILANNYQEPYDCIPYGITLSATDGLGLLKDFNFDDLNYQVRQKVSTVISDILAFVGITEYIEYINLYESTMDSDVDDSPLIQCGIDPLLFKDSTCYDALEEILKSFGAAIRQDTNGIVTIYRIIEQADIMYGRFYIYPSETEAIVKDPAQYFNRATQSSTFADHEGGNTLIISQSKNTIAHQDYGNKESWLTNWQIRAETYVNGQYEWWMHGPGWYKTTIPGVEQAMVMTYQGSPPSGYVWVMHTFGINAIASSDTFMFSFDFCTYNLSGANRTEIPISLIIKSNTGTPYYLEITDDELCEWTTTPTLITWDEDFPVGLSSFHEFKRRVNGLPDPGPYDIILYGPETSISTLYVAFKDIRFYNTSHQIVTYKTKSYMWPFGWLTKWKSKVKYTEVPEIVEKKYTIAGSSTGQEREYGFTIGDTNDAAIDNDIEQFSGALNVYSSDVPVNTSGIWNTRGGSEDDPLIKIIANELAGQFSRQKQLIDVPVFESSDNISLTGNFQDIINTYNGSNRIFVISRASFNVYNREWNITLNEIISSSFVITSVTLDDSTLDTNTSSHFDVAVTNNGIEGEDTIEWQLVDSSGNLVDVEYLTGEQSTGIIAHSGSDTIQINFQSPNDAGIYYIKCKISGGSWFTSSALTVSEPSSLTLYIEVITNCSAEGGSDGYIRVQATGGTAPYEYKLDSGSYQSDNFWDGLSAGTYTITVRDAVLATDVDNNVVVAEPTISKSTDITVGYLADSSGSSTITVTPDTLQTQATKIDTGDGTSWCQITAGATATGSFTLTAASKYMNEGTERSCTIRISDQADGADDEDVTFTQNAIPE